MGGGREGRFPPATCAPRSCGELFQQRLGLFEDWRVKPFGEPVVDRREEVTGFGTIALIAPEAGKGGGGAELDCFCPLSFRNYKRLAIAVLGGGWIVSRKQQIASQPMQLG